MTPRGRLSKGLLGVAAGAAAGLAAGGVARFARQRRTVHARPVDDEIELGSLHSPNLTVVADDGLRLHVEVDELDDATADPGFTLVFIHGYSLNLDCWHFQRAGYRGQVRSVYYDQRSHGRSGRSSDHHSTTDQLGRDLLRVLEDVTDGPVVLIGHSMGGMTIMSLASQHPDLFGSRIIGVALIATTAGDLDPGRILLPMVPRGISGGLVHRAVRILDRGYWLVDAARHYGEEIVEAVVTGYAFGGRVPPSYAEFTHDMLTATSFSVIADFFPSFARLDLWSHLEPLSRVPTAIISGTNDKITPVGLARKLHTHIQGSDLLEIPGTGHMVMLEDHDEVNRELDDLISRATRDLE